MSKKLSLDDFKRLAVNCPNLDMRLIEEWQALKADLDMPLIEEWRALRAEMERLGIRPRPSTLVRPKKPDSRYTQRISLKHF